MAVEKIKMFQLDDTEVASKVDVNTALSHAIASDISGGVAGLPTSSSVTMTYFMVRTVSYPADLAGSISKSSVASSSTAVFSIQKNGVQFATLTFPSSTDGVFSGAATTFVPGDVLTVIAPPSQDPTLSGVYFTFNGTLE
jgi:hypothetical protein